MTDDDNGSHAALAIAAGVELDIGPGDGSGRKRHKGISGVIRNLPVYVSNSGGFQGPQGVIVSNRPAQQRVWEVRMLSVWVIQPLGVQAGNVAIHIGSNADQAAAGLGNNLECLIPTLPLPLFETKIEVPIRNAEYLYAVLSSAANFGYMKLVVEEYNEDEYFYGVSRT